MMSSNPELYIRIPPEKAEIYHKSVITSFGKVGVISNSEINLEAFIPSRYITDNNDNNEVVGNIIAIQDSKLFSDLGISRFPESGGFISKESVGFSNEMKNSLYQIYNRQIIVNHIPFRSVIEFSLDDNIETVICPDSPTLHYLIPSALRNVANVCANRCGYLGIHCAAVEKNGSVYLIVGRGRSGKSTLYVNLLEKGLNPMNDDLVFLFSEGDDIIVKSIPLFAKLRLSSIPYIETSNSFPPYDPSKTIEHEIYLDCEKRYDRANSLSGKVKAIIFPKINNKHNRIRSVDFNQKKKDLFREIITQQTMVLNDNLIKLYGSLKKTPLYEVELSANISEACDMIFNEILL